MDATGNLSFRATHLIVLDAIDPQREMSTAASLVASLNARFAGAERKLLIEVIPIPDRRAFDTALSRVLDLAERDALPMIHFDGHGDFGGLLAANNDIYPWEPMWQHATRINIRCRNNLCVTMGVCRGLHSILMNGAFSIMNPAPAFALVAAQDLVATETVGAGFELFYENLFVNGTVRGAFEELVAIDALKPDGFYGRFRLITSQYLFERSADKYLREQCFGANGLARKQRLIYKERFVGPSRRGARKSLNSSLRGPQALKLAGYHEHFMMVDIYPELVPRLATDWVRFERRVHSEVLKQKQQQRRE